MKLWELACAFGAHRPQNPAFMGASRAAPRGAAAHDAALAELIANAERAQATGDVPEWSEPTELEQTALRRLLN